MGGVFDLENGITSGLLRLGIAQGDYIAYSRSRIPESGFNTS